MATSNDTFTSPATGASLFAKLSVALVLLVAAMGSAIFFVDRVNTRLLLRRAYSAA